MSVTEQEQYLESLAPEEAADVVEGLNDAQAAQIFERMDPSAAAAIVHELPSSEQADLVNDLPSSQADAILSAMDSTEAEQVRHLAHYPDHVAGGLMITELLKYPAYWTVEQVISDMRKNAEDYRDFEIQYAFVHEQNGKLVGVLRLRDLLLADNAVPIQSIMIKNPIAVSDEASLDDLRNLFEQKSFLGVPVVDADGKLLGLVTRHAVEEALGERADGDFLKSQGIVKEELRSMPLLVRSRRRLAWLSINIVLNIIAASIIAIFQDTLAQVIALAVFLPIISDMSGCSGNQAIAVSMRELSQDLIRPNEVLRVWLKEVSVGLILGVALGLLVAFIAILWKGNPYLGLVVGSALAINTLLAVSLGGILPLLIRLMGMDPALASGPVLTTVTDMCGFFIVLSLAALMLPYLS